MNFHISRWSPLRPQFSSSSLRSPTSRHHDPTGTNHDTVTTHATSPSSVTIEVDGVDTSDDDLTNLKRHRHHNTGLENNSSDKHHVNQDDDTTESESDISADDITQDSRDVLVQRLTDLADKLSESNVRNSSIEALHKQVDEMERVLRGASRTRSASRHSRASSRRARSLRPGSRPRSLQFAAPATAGAGSGAVMNGELSPRGRENALGIMGATPMSPSWFVSHFQRPPSIYFQDKDREGVMSPTAGVSKQPDVPSSSPSPSPSPRLNDLESKREASPRISHQQDSEAPPTKQQQQQPQQQEGARTHTSPHPEIPSEVTEVVREAEKMCAEMATIIENLQSRRQESDHLHKILNNRNQLSHQRRLQQQHQTQAEVIDDLEAILADHEADLRHLKVELRAIEAQCMGYVPKGADPELNESIRRWRQDWAALRDKFSSRRRKGPASLVGREMGSGGRRAVSLPSPYLSSRRGSDRGDGEGESNSSVSALTSPMSLR